MLMDTNEASIATLLILAFIIVISILSKTTSGTIAGYTVEMPLIGWFAVAFIGLLALLMFIKHRA